MGAALGLAMPREHAIAHEALEHGGGRPGYPGPVPPVPGWSPCPLRLQARWLILRKPGSGGLANTERMRGFPPTPTPVRGARSMRC